MEDADENTISAEDDWAADLSKPVDHPILAILGGSLLILIVGVSVPLGAGFAFLFGAVIGIAGVVWGVAYALTLKHSSRAWQIGSFVAMVLIAMLSALYHLGVAASKFDEDVGEVLGVAGKMFDNPSEIVNQEILESDGFMTAGMKTYYNSLMSETLAYDLLFVKSGAPEIGGEKLLQPGSPYLRDCGRFDHLRQIALRPVGGLENHFKKVELVVKSKPGDYAAKAEFLRGFHASTISNSAAYDRTWQLQAAAVEDIQRICYVLTRSRWTPAKSGYVFESQVVAEEFNIDVAKLSKTVDELLAIEEAKASKGKNALGHLDKMVE